ncbi:MAG TPA: hypothetical protein VHG72_16275 [Polyangia bacterium]|nr:hypothetical protein [Polyangia bacterium]
MRTQLTAALAVTLVLGGLACQGDPNDPMTWAKQLKDLRVQKEALDHLANMDVERARVAVPALIDLYNDAKRPEFLEALARYQDPRTKQLMIDALDYSDDDFDRATIAAGVLGEMKAPEAVDPLIKAVEKPLPIKSRANSTRVAAMRALVKIGDKRAVPTFMKILTTSADEQDFLLNQRAALGLAEFRDPQAIPALIKGMFMTGRGTDIFQECRLALVRIGPPAVDPLLDLMAGKNADVQQMAAQYKFDEATPGVIPKKAALVLGDLRAKKAVGPLVGLLHQKARGDERRYALISLGYIATPPAVDAILADLKDAKVDPAERASAADALYLSGDRRAVPTLLEIAKSGYIKTPDGTASDLRASAAIALANIAGKESYDAFKDLADKETAAQGAFGMAMDRMQVAKQCDQDLACYGKALNDPSSSRAQKGAFAIAFSGNSKQGLPLLLAALRPITAMAQERYPVHQAILFGLARLGTKDCKECIDKLEQQVEQDEKAVRIPGAKELLGETRVTEAIIQNQDAGDLSPASAAVAAADDVAPAPTGKAKPTGKGKVAKAGKAGKAGKARKKHR